MRTGFVGVFIGGPLAAAGLVGLVVPAALPWGSVVLELSTVQALIVFFAGIASLSIAAIPRRQHATQLFIGVGFLVLAVGGYVLPFLDSNEIRMRHIEVLAAALLGAVLVVFHVRRIPPTAVYLIWFVVGMAGLLELASQYVDVAVLSTRSGVFHLSPLIALALSGTVIVLWFQSHDPAWRDRFHVDSDDQKIFIIGGMILLVIVVSAGFAGVALMSDVTSEVLTNNLAISLEHRVRSFRTATDHGIENARLVGTRPRLNALLAKHIHAGINAKERQEVEKILDDILRNTPVVSLVVYDSRGKIFGERGSLVREPPFRAALGKSGEHELLWDGVTLLRANIPAISEGVPAGRMEMDIPLPAIDALFRDFAGLGDSGSMGVCTLRGESLLCMPTRLTKFRVIEAPRTIQGKPVPMNHALEGKTGIVSALDVHGENVVSAHAPIADSGLGMIVKVRTSEMYRSLMQQLGYALVVMAVLVIIGMVLLRWQITPLARDLVAQIRERKLAEERYQHLAQHDSLTGLPNRSLFHDRLQQAMIDAKRQGSAVALMFLDADRFKSVNDMLGHHTGDELLIQIAARLTSCLRAGDTVSRLAGDEFAIVLPGAEDIHSVRLLAGRILNCFNNPFQLHEHTVHVTTSIGVTLFPQDATTIEGLLKNADIAMYKVKEAGRNNFQFYSADMHAQALERLKLENELGGAAERGELVLHYQPLVNLCSGQIEGMEALLRWNHPVRGLVLPNDFIPLAEEAGLIRPIGDWVLRTACAQVRAWQIAGLPSMQLSVNLSARQFQADLTENIAKVLQETGLEPKYLELELTESVVMQNSEKAVAMLDALDQMGVRLSIDDFGTGYSSLSYLKRFPIDKLKVDRSFVRDIPDDRDDMLITTGIIGLAHSLGIRVVAEGVECQEQLEFLRAQNCDLMQGYLFSKPLPAEAFAQLVDRRSLKMADDSGAKVSGSLLPQTIPGM